jgi:hypothetical protein
LAGIAAGEIAARGPKIRHEQRIANEQCITDQMTHTGRRMARGVEGPRFNAAKAIAFTILK